MEALTPCHSSFGSHVVYGDGRSLNRRFSQVGSESGWRAAETNVAKSEAQKRGITLKIADGQQNKRIRSKPCAPLSPGRGCHLYCTRRGDRLGTRPEGSERR